MITACSNNDAQMNSESADKSTEGQSEESKSHGLSEAPSEEASEDSAQTVAENTNEKMMIYQAQINLETDDYDQFINSLKKKMDQNEAYLVETSIYKTEHGNREGHIRLRVPQKNFETLMTTFDEISDNIRSKNISGRDVTKEYVDLESRLEAKQKVETRLLTFLEQAEKTEDLIKISQDLERVQSDIESLKGQMKYLKNQSDFSTITLSITETKVVVPKIEKEQLNTWEKTKEAFMNSINRVLAFFSWMIVFIIGNSPILFLLFGIGLALWWIIRKRKKDDR